jgi:acyl carrier protein
MKTKDEIKKIVINELIKLLGADEDEITEDSNLQNDLGMDSLDAVELIMNFEQEFNIAIPDSDVENIKTVKEIIDYFFEQHIE